MNWDDIQSQWLRFKGEIKDRWGRLTDDDLDIINGRKDKLLADMQRKYSIVKEEAEQEIEEFLEILRSKEQHEAEHQGAHS